jgi:hypothetical protein
MKRALAACALVSIVAFAAAPALAERPKVGAQAPAFALESSTGKTLKLADWRGHTLVLAFFPKAFTGG